MESETAIKVIISNNFQKKSLIVCGILYGFILLVGIILIAISFSVPKKDSFWKLLEFGIMFIIVGGITPFVGLWADNRRRTKTDINVTERQIVGFYIGTNPYTRKSLNLPLEQITKVSAVQRKLSTFMGKELRIWATTGKIILSFVENADEVAAFLEAAIQQAKERSVEQDASSYEEQDIRPQRSQSDIADSLKKIADLRDAGIITEEEFEQKKKGILGKM